MGIQYRVWLTQQEEGFCNLEGLENVDRDFELRQGVSRKPGFPLNALCRMNRQRPKDIRMGDVIPGANLLVISPKVRALVEASGAEGLEFLPLNILNHKGKEASKGYSILNPLLIVDCIDTDRSGVTWNALNKGKIAMCKGAILKDDSIPPQRQIFRPRHWESKVVVADPLIESLQLAGCTGLFFLPFVGLRG